MPTWDDVLELARIGREQLAELVEDAWRLQAPKRLVAQHDADG